MDIRVTIYERVKTKGKWHEVPVHVPKLSKAGTLFQKDDKQGSFLISWYQNRKKQRQTVKSPVKNSRELPYLSDAVRLANSKAWYLNNRQHNVVDPTTAPARKSINEQVPLYLDAKSGCRKTLSAHRLALREFQEFAAEQRAQYVDEITKPMLHRFFEELLDSGNTPFTAANKILKVNSFYRAVMNLDAGKGIITKKDYKRELTSSKVPQVYSKAEMDAMFNVMDEDEHLVFSVLHEAGLRKKEFMHLEDTDLIQDELVPGKWKCEIRVESKPHWGYMTKTGATRNVLVSKELMDRLQRRKAVSRPSKLLFGARTGKPDYHLWDRLKAIAKRAGLDPTTVWLHKWRATAATNWLRSEKLGGKGWDIGFVRQQLGHEDLKSIEHYISHVQNAEMAMMMQ